MVHSMATIQEVLSGITEDLGIPCAYSHFKSPQIPPYIVYIGNGQTQLDGDNVLTWRRNVYQVEYYFAVKDEDLEREIEDALIAGGWKFSKSSDSFEQSQGLFVIFYDVG